jgi:hypothetical protein
MDMWPAYIRATRDAIPDADEKIAFDKFHVAKYLGDQSLEALAKLGSKMPTRSSEKGGLNDQETLVGHYQRDRDEGRQWWRRKYQPPYQ